MLIEQEKNIEIRIKQKEDYLQAVSKEAFCHQYLTARVEIRGIHISENFKNLNLNEKREFLNIVEIYSPETVNAQIEKFYKKSSEDFLAEGVDYFIGEHLSTLRVLEEGMEINKVPLIAAPVLILLGLGIITSISLVAVATFGGGVPAITFLAVSFSKINTCLFVGSVMGLGLGSVGAGGFFATKVKELVGLTEISRLDNEISCLS
jgi:hypothetical protein